jgi:uncharacterized membrane protein HdeD (DUF308 family)
MSAPARLAPWILPAGRGLLALALGLVITFTADHSAPLGLVSFGIFAILTGALIGAASIGSRAEPVARGAFLAQAAVTVVAGIAALALPAGGVHYLVLVLSGWAIIAGGLELVSGVRARGQVRVATDWIISGALTLALGIVVLVVPPDLVLPFQGEKGVTGVLTSSIVVVGVLGFWGVIDGVLWGISAASPRSQATPASAASEKSSVS